MKKQNYLDKFEVEVIKLLKDVTVNKTKTPEEAAAWIRQEQLNSFRRGVRFANGEKPKQKEVVATE